MGREPFRYDRFTVALWAVLGAVICATSVAAVLFIGLEGLYLIVTGWIVGPFVLYWIYRKLKKLVKGT
jgi:hypothetical protein